MNTGAAFPLMEPKMTVQDLMNKAFENARTPRSIEYREGCRALLNRRIHGDMMYCPYPAGSAQFDAWYAGVEEGWSLWRECDVPSFQ